MLGAALLWVASGSPAWSEPLADGLEQTLRRAEQEQRTGKVADAERHFAEALTKTKDKPDLQRQRNRCLLGLAPIYADSGRYSQALELRYAHHRFLERTGGLDGRLLLQNAIAIAELEEKMGRASKAKEILRSAMDREASQRVSPTIRVAALVQLAQLARLCGDDANPYWLKAASEAQAALEQIDAHGLPASFRPALARNLADCLEATNHRDQAIATLEKQLALQRKQSDEAELSLTWQALGTKCQAAGKRDDSRRAFEEAARLELRSGGKERQAAAIVANLAAVEGAAGLTEPAQEHWRRAAELYESAIARINRGESKRASLDACLDGLASVYGKLGDRANQLKTLRELLEWRSQVLGSEHSICRRMQARIGALCADGGDYASARPLLLAALACQRRLVPANPVEMADVLNKLATVEHALGANASALALASESLRIRQQHLSPTDPDLIGALYSVAGILAAEGNYTDAIGHYARAAQLCASGGAQSEPLRGKVLLGLAMAYKSQGQLSRAVEACRESLEVERRGREGDSMTLVPHYNALAALESLQGHYLEAQQWADRALKACAAAGQDQGALAASARNQLAVVCRQTGKLDQAERFWQEALDIYQRQGQAVQAAKTLNQLGVLAYQQQQFDRAEARFEQARTLSETGELPPQDQYSVLCNLATVDRRRGRNAEASRLLREAIQLTEIPRGATFGAERERAEFLARFARAFDLLVEWQLEEGRIAEAFATAERGRNRAFLDQLGLAGIDLRMTLEQDSPLLKREQGLSVRLSQLRIALRTAASGDPKQLDALRNDLARAQQEYAEVWTEIRDASKRYRALLANDRQLLDLSQVQQTVLDERSLMFCYYLGANKCQLFVIGHNRDDVWAFPLRISSPAPLSNLFEPRAAGQGNEASRGVIQTVPSPKGLLVADDAEDATLAQGPIHRAQLSRLVATYVATLRRVEHGDPRGIVGQSASPKEPRTLSAGALLGEILLPEAVRDLIRSRKPERLIIVPDGALRQLPFEAIVLSDLPTLKFALDEFPPISYAPSANILARLQARAVGPSQGAEVLAIGDPMYSPAQARRDDGAKRAASAAETRLAYGDFGGSLQPLPASRVECERIATAFPAGKVAVCLGAEATESKARSLIEGPRFVHFATHGLVSEGYENLFGAIALTPPGDDAPLPENDGFLELREIESLNLTGCELAVLSACETNVGADRPLESAATLAQAFLSAGAKRVVASHWSVADESTAELMGAYYLEIARQWSAGEPILYARALQRARLRLRNDPRWSAPYYWAPFVLIGPP